MRFSDKIQEYYFTLKKLESAKWFQFKKKKELNAKIDSLKESILSYDIFILCMYFVVLLSSIKPIWGNDKWNKYNIKFKPLTYVIFNIDGMNVDFLYGNSRFCVISKDITYMVSKNNKIPHIFEKEWEDIEKQLRVIIMETINDICVEILGANDG